MKEVRVPAAVYTYVVGQKYPMPGIAGGWARGAQPPDPAVRVASAVVVEHTAEWEPLEAGDRINFDYGGGGGWGDRWTGRPTSSSTTCWTST